MARKMAKTSDKVADLELKKVPKKAGNFDEKLELRTIKITEITELRTIENVYSKMKAGLMRI